MKIYSLILLMLYSLIGYCQFDTNSVLHPPLDIPLILSANFGELRPNHFHMGIDYRTNGKEGYPIHAIDDGYVSRVKVSPFGYGKVVYINHPNGITSVYAHCSSFIGKLDSLVKITQINEQNYEIEIKPDSSILQVKRGEIFALSGNTGNSSGPHLHFELRDTKTEIALNPLINGFEMKDTIPPNISGIKVYSLTKDVFRYPKKTKITNVVRYKNTFSIPKNLLEIPSDFSSDNGGIGFAIEANDHMNGHTHEFSYFGAYLIINQDTIFNQENDEISFDATKAINTHEDIEEYKKSKRKFQKSFRSQTNPLEIYSTDKLGLFPIHPKDSFNVKYVVYDTHNNQSEVNFQLKVLDGLKNKSVFNITNFLLPNSDFTYEDTICSVKIPEGCIYEPIPANINVKNGISVGDFSTPIHTPISVKIKIKNSELPVEKYFIKVSNSNKYLETRYEKGWLNAESKYLGNFIIDFDTIAPSIFPLNINLKDTLISKSNLTWKVNEEKSVLKDYDIYIDGSWQLLEYESKGSYLIYRKPDDLIGKHQVKLIVKDACGNINSWEKELWFN